MDSLRVMVTGAGSGVGQGVIKALRLGSLPKRIISADIGPLNAGMFRADEAVIIPRVEEAGALEQIVSILNTNDINVLMIGSEFDLAFFSRHKLEIEAKTGTIVVASPYETVQIANDKWLTAKFLHDHNLPYPESFLPTDVGQALQQAKSWGYPLLIKARGGTSSRNVHILRKAQDLEQVFSTVPDPVLQKLINMPSPNLEQEYTCSVFKCADGTVLGPFTARRTLRGGSSWIVEVDRFLEMEPLLLSIGEAIPSMGTLNVQLMMSSEGPVPFEFNARFSGTTAVRAFYGFNEPEMTLRNYVRGEKLAQPQIRKGLALRYLEEVFVEGCSADRLATPLPQGKVMTWF